MVLAKIPRAEFFGVACAGDQLIYEVTLTDLREQGAVVEAKAFLEGELLADVEIVFAHLDNSRANQIFGPKNFVFTQQLLGVLDLAKAQARAKEAADAATATRGLVIPPGFSTARPARDAPSPIEWRRFRRTIAQSTNCPTRWRLTSNPMPRTERRVVITGLGLVTPLGIGVEPVLVRARRPADGAVRKIQAFPVAGLPNDVGAEVPNLDKKAMIDLASRGSRSRSAKA